MAPGLARSLGAGAGAAIGGDGSAPYLSLAGALVALGAALLLCWPMLATTAPLVYFDTVSYFTNGEELWRRVLALLSLGGDAAGPAAALPPVAVAEGGAAIGAGAPPAASAAEVPGSVTIRSLVYAAFFYPASLTPLGLGLVCVLQTAMVLWSFLGLVPPLSVQGRGIALAGFAAVGTLSSLPWFASYAMPDILGAVLPIHFALALARADGLGAARRVVLMGIAAFAILSHYGHLPVALVLALAALAWRALRGRSTLAGTVFCLLPVAAAFAFNFAAGIAVNAAAGPPRIAVVDESAGRAPPASVLLLAARVEPAPAPAAALPDAGASFAPNRVPVLLARSIEDGPARWYLEEECAEVARYAICELFEEMPDNVWAILWAEDGLRSATPGQMARIRAEESEIVLAAARRYPLEQAAALARNTLHQTVLVGTGELLPLPEAGAAEPMADLTPRTADNEADPALRLFDWITPAFTGLAFLVLAWRVATGRTEHFLAEAALMTLFALLVNAAVYGGLSAPVDRYQSRLAWLIPALLALDLALSARRAEHPLR